MRTFRSRGGTVSGVLRPRTLVVCVVLAAATLLAFGYGMTIGSLPLSVSDVFAGVFGAGEQGPVYIVQELRLPRALVGLLAGLAFGMSGAVFQTVTRNPLASPDMIGINAGAAMAVVAGITLGTGSGIGVMALGVVGGLGSGLLVYALSWRRGTSGYRFILVGVGIAAIGTSTTDYLLTKGEISEAQVAIGWLVGNLNDRDWSQVQPLAIALLVLVPVALALSRWLRLLQLGDDVATGLGAPVGRARTVLLLAGIGLAAFATAAAGPIIFVALVAPQIAQRLAGLAWPPLVASGLTGSCTVLAADIVARQVLPSTHLPVGVITGALGAPVLLWLLARRA